jgi:hypothetical protein
VLLTAQIGCEQHSIKPMGISITNHPDVYNILRMKSMRSMNRMLALAAAIPWAALLPEPAPPPARRFGRCKGCSAHTVKVAQRTQDTQALA